VRKLTEAARARCSNGGVGGEGSADDDRTTPMLSGIIVTLIITGALGYALRGRDGRTIVRRPYSNRYNAASGAREESAL
jgi:hypothetical protein